jgi:type IV secretion system protein VirB6
LILGVQLALVEPWLSGILSARRAFIPTPAVPVQLLVLNLGFGLALLAALVATARVAYGFKLPPVWRHAGSRLMAPSSSTVFAAAPAVRESVTVGMRSQVETRAAAVAEAVASSNRREIRSPPPPPVHLTPAITNAGSSGQTAGASQYSTGRSSARRTRGRVATGSVRRDNKA